MGQTSMLAYKRAIRTGTVGRQAQTILDFLGERGESTRKEISVGTGIAINAVCGRAKELLDGDHVVVVAVRPCYITNNRAEVLQLFS